MPVAVPLVWAGLHVVRSASSLSGWLAVGSARSGHAIAAGGVLFALVAAALALAPVARWRPSPCSWCSAWSRDSPRRRSGSSWRGWRPPHRRGFGAYHALTGVAALPAGLRSARRTRSGAGRARSRRRRSGMLVAAGGLARGGAPTHGRRERMNKMVWSGARRLPWSRDGSRGRDGAGAHPRGRAGRATYSELHEGLRPGTPAADSALARAPGAAARRCSGGGCAPRSAIAAPWNDAPLALTRLAELRDRGLRRQRGAARAARSRRARSTAPPGQDPARLPRPAPRRRARARAGAARATRPC